MNKQKKVVAVLLVAFLGIFLSIKGNASHASSSDSVELRFVFTTDLHGQLTTTNYEANEPFNTGSLAKAYTLIQNAKAEMPEGNTFTFDIGDVLYDYTTETIFEMQPEVVQPIYKALADMDYDAIVLGNHEFEYGYDYLMNQMNQSGLKDICVVSNLYDAKTGKNVFHKNMLLSRQVMTEDGKTATIKIGIIGETIPVLSKKRENYTGIFETEDIVENTKKQAKELKERGADVVVVLAHSGFGVENPAELSQNVSYALTKIDEVDVVLCGHEHKMFPSTSAESAIFYNNSGVSKKTGLVNGKNLVMANNKGQSIGVVDLTVKTTDGVKKIINRSSEVRKVQSYTAINEEINKGYDDWKNIFTTNSTTVVGEVALGQSFTNYMGLVEDTSSIQLLNNAMIRNALQYVNGSGKQYKNEPIIAASNHALYGQQSGDEFVKLGGKITESDLSSIATFHRNLYLYEITGKQLREWLEWSASAYETTSETVTWTDENMNQMMTLSSAKSLISEDWIDEWGSFYIFDGIDYTINPVVEPRYNYNGELIHQTSRISSLTYNGVQVTDNTKFVLATQSLVGLKTEALGDIENQVIRKGSTNRLTALTSYVKQLYQIGDLMPFVDNNWRLQLPYEGNYILKLNKRFSFDATETNWIPTELSAVGNYKYYKVQHQGNISDADAPNVVLASTNEKKTNQDIAIAVNATDSSGIKTLKYAFGNYGTEFYNWEDKDQIGENKLFTASENGIYTVYAEDNNGNKTVSKINVTNINREILQVPTINSYTNRTTKITGTAEPGAQVYITTQTGNYQSEVNEYGSFTCKLPMQNAKDTVTVYVSDKYGRRSEKVTVIVKRTGPNYPEIQTINNNVTKVTGNTHDSIKTIFAVVGDKVYVSSKDGASDYKKCEKYNSSKKIVKTKVSVGADGSFSLVLPAQRASTSVTVYALDYVGRVSKSNTSKVANVAPNPPTIYAVSNGENQVNGRVYSATTGVLYNVTVTVGGESYTALTDVDGYFTATVGDLTLGQKISVYATDTVENVIRKSATIQSNVKDIKAYVSTDEYKYVAVDEITDKTETITGFCEDGNVTVILKVDDQVYLVDTDEDGYFQFPLTSVLEKGTHISAVVRLNHGGIIGADMGTVVLGKPYEPILINPAVYNSTRRLAITSTEKGSVTVKIGDTDYTSKDYQYDETLKAYLYNITIKNVNSGNEVSIYATNAAGNSTKLILPVIQKAPNTPKTDQVSTSSKTIRGTVNLLISAASGENEQVPTVVNTQTKVYAKIGSKTYEAAIKDNGSYVIKIPKQKAKTKIVLWAENAQGKGPSKIIQVKQAKMSK